MIGERNEAVAPVESVGSIILGLAHYCQSTQIVAHGEAPGQRIKE